MKDRQPKRRQPKGRPPARWQEFPAAVRALQGALDRLTNASAIIGGVAVISHGVPRFTEDIDATIAGTNLDLSNLMSTLARAKIVPRIQDWRELVERAQVLLMLHEPTGIGVDISLAWLPFEQEAMDRAETKPFAGAIIRAVRAEDLLIYKLIAHRPQDLWDTERLLLFHHAVIDLRRVRSVLASLAEHLEGPDRIASLEEVLARLQRENKDGKNEAVSPAKPKAARRRKQASSTATESASRRKGPTGGRPKKR